MVKFDFRTITKASRINTASSRYTDEGFIVEYDGTIYFIDTEGQEIPEDADWFTIERNFVFDQIDKEDDYSYFIGDNNKCYSPEELLADMQKVVEVCD